MCSRVTGEVNFKWMVCALIGTVCDRTRQSILREREAGCSMRHTLAVAVTFVLLASCGYARPQAESGQTKGAAQETAQQYFPPGVFGQDTYYEHWYTSLLAAMREPSLFETARKSETAEYRLLIGLNDRALSFRLELLVDGTGELTVARVIFNSGKPDSVILNNRVQVSAERVHDFQTLLQKSRFLEIGHRREARQRPLPVRRNAVGFGRRKQPRVSRGGPSLAKR